MVKIAELRRSTRSQRAETRVTYAGNGRAINSAPAAGPRVPGLRRWIVTLLLVAAGVSLFLTLEPATSAGLAVGLILGASLAWSFAWREGRDAHRIPAIHAVQRARCFIRNAKLAAESERARAGVLANLDEVTRELLDVGAGGRS